MREELRREVHIPDALAAEALRRLHQPLGGMALLRWGVHPRAAWAVATHHRERAPGGDGDDPAPRDRRSEVVFLAERLDLAVHAGRPVALDEWAAAGRLTADPERVRAAVARAAAA
jgi:hypothetical protein